MKWTILKESWNLKFTHYRLHMHDRYNYQTDYCNLHASHPLMLDHMMFPKIILFYHDLVPYKSLLITFKPLV